MPSKNNLIAINSDEMTKEPRKPYIINTVMKELWCKCVVCTETSFRSDGKGRKYNISLFLCLD